MLALLPLALKNLKKGLELLKRGDQKWRWKLMWTLLLLWGVWIVFMYYNHKQLVSSGLYKWGM